MKRGICLLLVLLTLVVKAQERAAWMKDARFGVMTHYLPDWLSKTEGLTIDIAKWNDLVDQFNVDALADQVKSVGAGYMIFTIGQNSGYYGAPNATYDKFVGRQTSRCSKRDLIGDLGTALHKRGLKFIVYLPSGAPNGDSLAKKALQWQNGPYRNKEFQEKWEQVIRDWAVRWGDKIDGWWFDGCYWPNIMYRTEEKPNFKSFAAAARVLVPGVSGDASLCDGAPVEIQSAQRVQPGGFTPELLVGAAAGGGDGDGCRCVCWAVDRGRSGRRVAGNGQRGGGESGGEQCAQRDPYFSCGMVMHGGSFTRCVMTPEPCAAPVEIQLRKLRGRLRLG